jgi:putative tricarboxylic transport membrane protein
VARAGVERAAGLALLAFSLGYFLLAFGIRTPPSSVDSPLSARSFPFALGIAGIVLSALIVLRPPPGDPVPWGSLWWRRAGGLLALVGLYALAIPHLGFVVVSALFLAGGFVVLGERRIPLLAGVAVTTALAFFFLFRLLDVNLDWGVFEGIVG